MRSWAICADLLHGRRSTEAVRSLTPVAGLSLKSQTGNPALSCFITRQPISGPWVLALRLTATKIFTMSSVHANLARQALVWQRLSGQSLFFGGAGIASGVNGNPSIIALPPTAVSPADWETRSLFASYRARYLDAAHFGNAVHAGCEGWFCSL